MSSMPEPAIPEEGRGRAQTEEATDSSMCALKGNTVVKRTGYFDSKEMSPLLYTHTALHVTDWNVSERLMMH